MVNVGDKGCAEVEEEEEILTFDIVVVVLEASFSSLQMAMLLFLDVSGVVGEVAVVPIVPVTVVVKEGDADLVVMARSLAGNIIALVRVVEDDSTVVCSLMKGGGVWHTRKVLRRGTSKTRKRKDKFKKKEWLPIGWTEKKACRSSVEGRGSQVGLECLFMSTKRKIVGTDDTS